MLMDACVQGGDLRNGEEVRVLGPGAPGMLRVERRDGITSEVAASNVHAAPASGTTECY